jgi:hypothetical protein
MAEKTEQRRMVPKGVERQCRIAGQPFTLRTRDVLRVMRSLDPEPISSHFVVVGSRRFPPKQVISAVTGLDRADFTTHQARRTLMRLGFAAGRRAAGAAADPHHSGPVRERSSGDVPLIDRLIPLRGQWVAIKNDDVLHASATPQELVGWLNRHGQKADTVYRVPESESAATGLAPL